MLILEQASYNVHPQLPHLVFRHSIVLPFLITPQCLGFFYRHIFLSRSIRIWTFHLNRIFFFCFIQTSVLLSQICNFHKRGTCLNRAQSLTFSHLNRNWSQHEGPNAQGTLWHLWLTQLSPPEAHLDLCEEGRGKALAFWWLLGMKIGYMNTPFHIPWGTVNQNMVRTKHCVLTAVKMSALDMPRAWCKAWVTFQKAVFVHMTFVWRSECYFDLNVWTPATEKSTTRFTESSRENDSRWVLLHRNKLVEAVGTLGKTTCTNLTFPKTFSVLLGMF